MKLSRVVKNRIYGIAGQCPDEPFVDSQQDEGLIRSAQELLRDKHQDICYRHGSVRVLHVFKGSNKVFIESGALVLGHKAGALAIDPVELCTILDVQTPQGGNAQNTQI